MKALASAPSFRITIPDFVQQGSIVRKIWGDPDVVLLIFAGSAAEFALNKAVDWLFFTGEIPRDPIGRLFSTVRYAQDIVFADAETAQRTLERINAQHASVEHDRKQAIPDWAYRDVLYMLIDYSERAYALLYGPLSQAQKSDLFEVFLRVARNQKLPVRVAKTWFARADFLPSTLTADDVYIDQTLDINPTVAPQDWAKFYTDALKKLEPGVTEVIIHLAYDDAEMRAATTNHPDWGTAWRQRDFEFFTSDAFRKVLQENNIKLITWREIGKLIK
jgi:hypothetical protein